MLAVEFVVVLVVVMFQSWRCSGAPPYSSTNPAFNESRAKLSSNREEEDDDDDDGEEDCTPATMMKLPSMQRKDGSRCVDPTHRLSHILLGLNF